jgi:hypothetical protein
MQAPRAPLSDFHPVPIEKLDWRLLLAGVPEQRDIL